MYEHLNTFPSHRKILDFFNIAMLLRRLRHNATPYRVEKVVPKYTPYRTNPAQDQRTGLACILHCRIRVGPSLAPRNCAWAIRHCLVLYRPACNPRCCHRRIAAPRPYRYSLAQRTCRASSHVRIHHSSFHYPRTYTAWYYISLILPGHLVPASSRSCHALGSSSGHASNVCSALQLPPLSTLVICRTELVGPGSAVAMLYGQETDGSKDIVDNHVYSHARESHV